ncbi:MAG: signal peptidase I [Eubacteriales bacterium]
MSHSKEKFKPVRLSPAKKKEKTPREEFVSWIISLVVAVAIALALRFFVFDFVVVEQSSMETTLYTGEWLFLEKVTYRFDDPDEGDIIVCHFDEGTKNYVKRVVGVSGDTVEIREGVTYINGVAIEEPYLHEPELGTLAPTVVDEDSVFVMGDNRNHSLDSRVVGTIPYERIRGRVVFRAWPFTKFGKVD